MYFLIYKSINLLNGKFYIGKHKTNNPNDSYLGSGLAIKEAIKKYGRQNFTKEILFFCASEEEMNQKEKEIVDEVLVANNDNYNMSVGGEGGPHFKGRFHTKETKAKLSEKVKAKISSKEAKDKISAGLKKFRQNNPNYYKGENTSNYKSFWARNTQTNESKMFKQGSELPNGWVRGRKIKAK